MESAGGKLELMPGKVIVITGGASGIGLVRMPTTDRTTALHPGAEAAMLSAVPQGRWCEPEEVAEAAIFLCSKRASHTTGHVMPVDGGWTAR
jgi:NAD(P)-dependent dehydrogenase (short-subunit alcohol dehydrogenase family)